MERDMMLVRIYISEADHGSHDGLLEEIMAILHDEHRVHGVTVFRGIVGFGRKGQVHSADLLRLRANLPLVVEFFDEPQIVDAALKALNPLVSPGHVVKWMVQCLTAEKECGDSR